VASWSFDYPNGVCYALFGLGIHPMNLTDEKKEEE